MINEQLVWLSVRRRKKIPDLFDLHYLNIFISLHFSVSMSSCLFLWIYFYQMMWQLWPAQSVPVTLVTSESTWGNFTAAKKHKYWINHSESLWVYFSYNLCLHVGVLSNNIWIYVTYFSVCVRFYAAECYLSWQRDQHRWWRCSLFLALAECSSGQSSVPLWTWTVRIPVKSHFNAQTLVVDFKRDRLVTTGSQIHVNRWTYCKSQWMHSLHWIHKYSGWTSHDYIVIYVLTFLHTHSTWNSA